MESKILIVDDEEEIGMLMRAILLSAGYKPLYAPNLREAEAILKSEKVSLVFLDLNLGQEYGLNLIPTIKESDKTTDIVVITAERARETEVKNASNDVRQLIEKPFSKKEILSVLKMCA